MKNSFERLCMLAGEQCRYRNFEVGAPESVKSTDYLTVDEFFWLELESEA